MIDQLSQDEAQQFIEDHLNDHPANLMFQASRYPHLPMGQVVEQITSKRKAKYKIPEWFATRGIIYPPRLSMEQCSSQVTAEYKASLVEGESMVDLTGGFGVDSYFLSKSFQKAHYVERYAHLVELANHNFSQLKAAHISLHEAQASTFLESIQEPVDLIFLDPARRDTENKKVVLLADCEPNVVELMPLLRQKARTIMIKTSPMLDIKKAMADLEGVSSVHVVADRNEVKELLFVINVSDQGLEPQVHCQNFMGNELESFTFDYKQEGEMQAELGVVDQYLYEPNASILKAGAFKSITRDFSLKKLHNNTHLYTASEAGFSFPGRIFKVLDKVSLNKKQLRKVLPDLKANVTVRNYPMTVAQIRKKTGLKEGGELFLIGLTDVKKAQVLLAARVS